MENPAIMEEVVLSGNKLWCMFCKGTDFELKDYEFHLKIDGKMREFISEAYVCKKCDKAVMTGNQMTDLRFQIAMLGRFYAKT